MSITVVDGQTDNGNTSAVSVIKGNTYAVLVDSPTSDYDSGSVALEQTIDGTNYFTDRGFTGMSADGIQTFVAASDKVRFAVSGVAGASADIDITIDDLGGLGNENKDFSRHSMAVTNS